MLAFAEKTWRLTCMSHAYFPKLPVISNANPIVSQLTIYFAVYNQRKQRMKEKGSKKRYREREKERLREGRRGATLITQGREYVDCTRSF